MFLKELKKTFVVLLLTACATKSKAQIPKVSSGSIQHLENFPSRYLPARNVDVWLPDDYDPSKKYAVLYMQDGRGLFDSTILWNHQEWGVDETMGRLLAAKKISNCIVVGIWNGEARRHAEYFPQQPFLLLTTEQQNALYNIRRNENTSLFADSIQSDRYLQFMVDELKPYIDSHFSTYPDPEHTFVAGSSMGGLISLYAICEYPGVFGGAACLSTHWTGIFTTKDNPVPGAFLQYLEKKLPDPAHHKIYFDYGTQTLDSLYELYQQAVDALMQSKGFSKKNWMTQKFIGADHSENAWNKRLSIPVLFLLGKKK
ncbi:MAG: esterase [Terrimonas sp.]|nr:esterase [Terrimonas sp.]